MAGPSPVQIRVLAGKPVGCEADRRRNDDRPKLVDRNEAARGEAGMISAGCERALPPSTDEAELIVMGVEPVLLPDKIMLGETDEHLGSGGPLRSRWHPAGEE